MNGLEQKALDSCACDSNNENLERMNRLSTAKRYAGNEWKA